MEGKLEEHCVCLECTSWRRLVDARLAAVDTAISLAKWAIPVSVTITALILAVVLR